MTARDDYPYLHEGADQLDYDDQADRMCAEIDRLRLLMDALEVIARPSRDMTHDEIVEQCSARNLLADWKRGKL